MTKLVYPLRVIFCGGLDRDGIAADGYEIHGPFRRPGELWRWANRECYLNVYLGWRADLNALIQKNAPSGWRAIKCAFDDWAIQDLEAYDYAEARRARVLQGDAVWRAWRFDWDEQAHPTAAPPDDWRTAGPIASCRCEDWPCCVHADDFIYIAC